ncbi:MAG: serine--tRNA ligase [Pseudomonadota bacterium]
MLDIKWIRDNPEALDNALNRRGAKPQAAHVIEVDSQNRQIMTLIQQLQHARKDKSKAMSQIKNKASSEFLDARKDAEHINEKLEELMTKASSMPSLDSILERLPNIPAPDVPEGFSEEDAKLIRTVGKPREILHAKNHEDLGESLGVIDFAQTSKISGSRFVTLKGDLARMERALVNFMLDIQTKEFDFLELSPPCLVRPVAMYNVGQLPKFEEDSFVTTTDYRLIPTGEVPLVNMVADSIIAREKLPMRFTAHTPCFRSEAGSAGRDTRGMMRMHQFSKVELVSITTPDESEEEHEYILNAAETVLKKLDLPYRVIMLAAGDMSFTAHKTYDIEVWMPGQNKYREISSCSNCGDFQARRMKARYKEFGAQETTFVHTLNGSGLPIGRTLIAIMENYQNPDGSISVPQALQSYMGGMDRIEMSK